ncbi:MAG: 4-hydroxy-tetrahydrodipicolinate synthase [Paludibacteraceae bacterium]|nr:4-hydroxy-tetrahydrodipicolinate synthase [Paludibacteraceae bacterium]
MGVALITPFAEDGSVDYTALGKLVDYQLQSGIDYMVVLGSTGETPTLTEEEKDTITRFVIGRINGRVPVVLGVGGNYTQAVADRLKNLPYEGVDAVLSVVPYYNKPSQEGIYQHYATLARASKVPIILYNVPSRTGVNMAAETTIRLANEFDNIIAVKEASGNMAQMEKIIKNTSDDFYVISGDDGLAYPAISVGAKGVISVIGNAFPKEFSRMVRLALAGDYMNALPIHQQFTELFDLLFVDGNPAGVKSMLSAMGYIGNRLRLPLVPTRITTYESIRRVLIGLNVKC